MNLKKGKTLWSFWISKRKSNELDDAMFNKDYEVALEIIKQSVEEGLVERKWK